LPPEPVLKEEDDKLPELVKESKDEREKWSMPWEFTTSERDLLIKEAWGSGDIELAPVQDRLEKREQFVVDPESNQLGKYYETAGGNCW
jgi:hypothetical protein